LSETSAGKTLVMTATYNEIDNLPRLVDEVLGIATNVDLLVVDDNSPDGTGKWCDQKMIGEPRLRCLHRAGKQGLGTAIIAGMRYAIEHAYTHVLNMDADFSHHPRYLPALIAAMDQPGTRPVDVAIGSRYIRGGGIDGWPIRRHAMSRGVNLYARWLLWLSPRDCSGGYRCYRTSTLARLNLNDIRSRGYSFQEEVLWLLRRSGARFVEVPIVFADREKGLSKINGAEAVSALRIILQLGMKNLIGRS